MNHLGIGTHAGNSQSRNFLLKVRRHNDNATRSSFATHLILAELGPAEGHIAPGARAELGRHGAGDVQSGERKQRLPVSCYLWPSLPSATATAMTRRSTVYRGNGKI